MAEHAGAMITSPVLDTEALRRLGEELGDADILCGFLRRYVALLDQRIGRLQRALAAQDHEGWMDAVLSLKTSSALAGARALADLAAGLQQDAEHSRAASWLRWSAAECRAEGMNILRGVAAETARQLQLFIRHTGGPAARTT